MSDEAGPPTNTPDWEELQQGVRKCITKEGTNPKVYGAPGMEVCVHYTGTLPGSTEPFDCSRKRGQPFTFELGAGSVITGWDAAFEKIAVGERALLEIESEWAYGKEGHPPTIPPDSTLHFDVELLSVGEKKKELNMMTADEKLSEASKQKQKGLDAYQRKDWAEARSLFAEAIFYCDAAYYSRENKAMPTDVGNIYLSAHLNASQCALNEKDWPGACAYATRAIKCVPDSVKCCVEINQCVGWPHRAVRKRHRHAIEQASRRWRAGRREYHERAVKFDFHTGQGLISARRRADPHGVVGGS